MGNATDPATQTGAWVADRGRSVIDGRADRWQAGRHAFIEQQTLRGMIRQCGGLLLGTLLALALSCAGCVPPDRPPPEDVAAAILEADNRRDLDSVLAMYADSARLLPPNEPPVIGREAIRERYEGIFASSRPQMGGTVVRMFRAPDLAVIEGTVEGFVDLVDTGERRAVNDKYVMVLTYDPVGRWRIAQLIWSATPMVPEGTLESGGESGRE